MSKKTKAWLIIAAFLTVIGTIMLAAALTAYNWDFTKLSTVKYKARTYEVSDKFDGISMNTDTADITLALSDNGKSKVECYNDERIQYSVYVENDTLLINTIDEREWYEHIAINVHTPKITLYLPKNEYASLIIKEDTGDIEIPKDFYFKNVDISLSTGDVSCFVPTSDSIKINTSTGDISLENIYTNTLDLSVSTGRTNLTDIKCKNVISSGSTGDIFLKNVITTEKLSIKRSTGDVKLVSCDAAEILIKTDTGDITGNLLTDKVFITETDTGSIDVPKALNGGRCEITTDTGDIKFTVN